MYLYDRYMISTPYLNNANPSLMYYAIITVKIFNLNSKNSKFFAFPRQEVMSSSKQHPRNGCCLRATSSEAT